MAVALGFFHVAIRERDLQILVHRERIQQMVALEHEAEVLLVQLVAILLLEPVNGEIQQVVLAAPGAIVHADDVQQRGFARAGGSHDGDELALFDVTLTRRRTKVLVGPCSKYFSTFRNWIKSFSRSSLLTAAGSAWPRLAFITMPTKKPSTVVLPPRYCSTCLGLAAMTSSTILDSALTSLIWLRQGFELQCLQGCRELLPHFKYIYSECAFREFYAGQVLASRLIEFAFEQGFDLTEICHLSHDSDGRSLDADLLFTRRESLA